MSNAVPTLPTLLRTGNADAEEVAVCAADVLDEVQGTAEAALNRLPGLLPGRRVWRQGRGRR